MEEVVKRACAQAQALLDEGAPCVVHGDIGAHNLLVHDDRLTAILDWEFSRVGDPAEDLGVARPNVIACMDWDEFLRIYRDAGGRPVPLGVFSVGFLLSQYRAISDYPAMIAMMIVILAIGILIDGVLFAALDRKVRQLYGLTND
jgi:aminoglycoside phosphotransferase (APT) family kinase protein